MFILSRQERQVVLFLSVLALAGMGIDYLAWGLEILCLNPEEYSPVLTAVVMPGNKGADAYRAAVLEKFNMSLGNGLGKLKDRVFRIGHLGAFNDLMLIGTLGGIEMGFALTGVPYTPGGVGEAMAYLAGSEDRFSKY